MEVRDNYYTIVQGTVKLKVFTASLDEALHDEDLPRVRRLLLANWPPFHSPLMVASEQGWLSVVNRLLKAAANREDIDKKTHNTGMTALHFAICHSHFDIAFLLLENGASLFPKNKRGNSPLDSIQRLSQWWEVEDLVLQTWEKVDELKKGGRKTKETHTPRGTGKKRNFLWIPLDGHLEPSQLRTETRFCAVLVLA